MEHFHGAMIASLQKWHLMQNIGDMDIDQVIDVPDTPDRLAAQNINREVCVENGSDASVAGDSGKSNFILRGRSRLISEEGLHRGLHFHSHKTLNNLEATERQNNAIFHTPESSSVSRNTHLYRRVVEGKNSKHETRNSFGDQLRDKGKALCDKSLVKASTFQVGNADLDSMEQTGYSRILGKGLMRGASKDPLAEECKERLIARNKSLHCMPNSSKTAGTYRNGKEKSGEDTSGVLSMDHRKGVDFIGTGKFVSAPFHSIASPRVTGQKRLVRNGCISPLNIAKVKQSAEQKHNSCGSKDAGDTNTGNLVSRSPSYLIDISDLSAEGNNHIRTKGKGVLNSCTAKEFDAKTRPFPVSSIRHNEEANGTNDVNGNVSGCFEELGGWRRTGNRSKKMHLPLPDEDLNLPRIHNVANKLLESQKKHGSTSSNHSEHSASGLDDSEIMFLGSSVNSSLESSSSSSTRNWSSRRRCILDPVIEVDELSPEMGPHDSQHVAHKNDGASDARARQLEADEILALELQQQLYQETPIRGGGESDAHIAWTLQQEDAAERASSGGNHNVLHPRGSSISAMHRQSQPRSLQNPSHRRRLHARVSTSGRMAQLRSQIRSQAPSILPRGRNLFPLPSDMDLDMRIDILEALEAAYGDFGDTRMEDHILQVQRDFNENDYEMLLALDENNYQHGGARVDQINRLPQSIVQAENLEEACAICLETPTAGETIRHLPCLHKFHKDCIDPWLSRRTSCPVCKLSIT